MYKRHDIIVKKSWSYSTI